MFNAMAQGQLHPQLGRSIRPTPTVQGTDHGSNASRRSDASQDTVPIAVRKTRNIASTSRMPGTLLISQQKRNRSRHGGLPMADPRLVRRLHLRVGPCMALGNEDRVVAKAVFAFHVFGDAANPLARNSSVSPVGRATATTHTNRARRAASPVSARLRRSKSQRSRSDNPGSP